VNKHVIIATLAAVLFAGCANNSPIGTIDVNRVVSNWDVYQRYQQQLLIEEQGIANGKGSNADKGRQVQALRKKYADITDALSKQIRDAASKIAQTRNLKLVVTKEGVGYGGVDITSDVEKAMNITEKAAASPT
jgi:Skp family chaperone for outer membrane proteins